MRHSDEVSQMVARLKSAGIVVTRRECADFMAATTGKIADAEAEVIIREFQAKLDPSGDVSEKKLDLHEELDLAVRLTDKLDIPCPPDEFIPSVDDGSYHCCYAETVEQFSKRVKHSVARLYAMSDKELARLPSAEQAGVKPDKLCMFTASYRSQASVDPVYAARWLRK